MSLFLQPLRALPRMGVRPLVGLLLGKQDTRFTRWLLCFCYIMRMLCVTRSALCPKSAGHLFWGHAPCLPAAAAAISASSSILRVLATPLAIQDRPTAATATAAAPSLSDATSE